MQTASSRLLPLLAFANVLAGMLLVPVARPFLAARYPDSSAALHAFFSVNMLGAALGAPLAAWLADRLGSRRFMAVALSVLDAALLAACLAPMPLVALLALRTVQGAASVGALSILMGATRATATGEHGGAMGRMAAAVVAGIALGAPVGTLLLSAGPVAAFGVAAALALGVAGGATSIPGAPPAVATPAERHVIARWGVLKLPSLMVAAERFAVGCFVTTFSLYAHEVLGLSDRQVGGAFSTFLFCFAGASAAAGALAGRVDRRALVFGGAGALGLGFFVLGSVPAALVWPVLAVMGLASGGIYAPALCLASQPVPPAQRATAMGVLNAAGTLGMMAGTALAGVVTGALTRAGFSRAELSTVVFVLAGSAQWLALAAAFPQLLKAVVRQESRG